MITLTTKNQEFTFINKCFSFIYRKYSSYAKAVTSQLKETNVKGNQSQNADQFHDGSMTADVVFLIDDDAVEGDNDASSNGSEDVVFLGEMVKTNEDIVDAVASKGHDDEAVQADVGGDLSPVVSSSGSDVNVRIADNDPSDDRWEAQDRYESSDDDLIRPAFMSCDTNIPEVRQLI